ncbi:MAG: hypothetical protein HFE78_02980 [Clostridiales bacterium]|nr:hypothetical protein [Clostridiales bacterium]
MKKAAFGRFLFCKFSRINSIRNRSGFDCNRSDFGCIHSGFDCNRSDYGCVHSGSGCICSGFDINS